MRTKLVLEKLVLSGAKNVLDLGCGEGNLLQELIKEKQFTEVVGVDVSYNELLKAKTRLRFDQMPSQKKEKIKLFQSSIFYRDKRLQGFDAVVLMEVIEHLEFNRLETFEKVLFEFIKPRYIILTTPNREYNIVWEKHLKGKLRHDDHRFEWTRKEFTQWGNSIAKKYAYDLEFFPIGKDLEDIGSPSQGVIFKYGNQNT